MNTNTLRRMRELLYNLQGGVCCYCGRPVFHIHIEGHRHKVMSRFGLRKRQTVGLAATLEHLNQQANGGSNHPDNLALACHYCNSRRHSMPWNAFKQQMQEKFAGWLANCRETNIASGYQPALELKEHAEND